MTIEENETWLSLDHTFSSTSKKCLLCACIITSLVTTMKVGVLHSQCKTCSLLEPIHTLHGWVVSEIIKFINYFVNNDFMVTHSMNSIISQTTQPRKV